MIYPDNKVLLQYWTRELDLGSSAWHCIVLLLMRQRAVVICELLRKCEMTHSKKYLIRFKKESLLQNHVTDLSPKLLIL